MKEDDAIITVELEGRKIKVPAGLTVIEALWDTGHDVKRGIGCLSGLCGACTVAYIEKESKKVKFGLGCQKVIEEGMNVIMIPCFPCRAARYSLASAEKPLEQLDKVYDELYTCNDCRSCNICPEWINVAGVMRSAMAADYESAAAHVTDCIMCGLCASRCPRNIAPHYVALYIQRSLSRERPFPPNLGKRLEELAAFTYDGDWSRIAAMDDEALKQFCASMEGA